MTEQDGSGCGEGDDELRQCRDTVYWTLLCAHRPPAYASVTAPTLALDTSFAYLASTPEV